VDCGRCGAAPTKFGDAELRPWTARFLAAQPLEAVAPDLAGAGVPNELAERFWSVVRENIERRGDIATWWQLFSEGATAVVADEDRDFVATAFSLLGAPPYTADTWSAWTAEVKAQTGRKGRGLFMPLRSAVTGRTRGPEMADVMPLLQVKPRL